MPKHLTKVFVAIVLVFLAQHPLKLPAFAETLQQTNTHSDEVRAGLQHFLEKSITKASFKTVSARYNSEAKKELSKFIDLSEVENEDVDLYIELLVDNIAEELASRLRASFEKKLLKEMTKEDLAMFVACRLKQPQCNITGISSNGWKTLQTFKAYGRSEGKRIGESLGFAAGPEVMQQIAENKNGKFKNPDALIKALTSPEASNIINEWIKKR